MARQRSTPLFTLTTGAFVGSERLAKCVSRPPTTHETRGRRVARPEDSTGRREDRKVGGIFYLGEPCARVEPWFWRSTTRDAVPMTHGDGQHKPQTLPT